MTGYTGVLPISMQKLIWIAISCDPEFYWGRPVELHLEPVYLQIEQKCYSAVAMVISEFFE